MGRPREFDADEALQSAMELFWRKGYEGTSLADLTDGMGITRPSLYGAFGNKEELFRKALARYDETRMAFAREALLEPTARGVVERLLTGFAEAQTADCGARGCLGINAALACSEGADAVRRAMIERRQAGEAALTDRLRRARDEGDLGADCDPADLARYVMTVVHGMAVQAASGADREALQAIARMTLRGWPSA